MSHLKELLIIIYGFIVLIFYISFKRQGTGKFYLKAQDSKFLKNFLKSKILNFLFKNFRYFEKNIDKDLSQESQLYKNNDSILQKYTNFNYGLSENVKLEDQQRGFGIQILRNILKNDEIKNIIEIGTGNGDLISLFASEFKNKKFTGLEFNVDTAKKKHKSENLNFVSEYALNYFQKSDVDGIDLVFATSTFIFFTPKELKEYIKIFSKKCKFIIIIDPTWFGINKKKYLKNTYHLENGVFFHDYNHYLKNFTLIENKFYKYKHKSSQRPDIYLNIIIAKNKNL